MFQYAVRGKAGESGAAHDLGEGQSVGALEGGNLADGTVKGDALACPFHDWRWGGDGGCAGIPYAHRVPRRARIRAWRTLEENRQLFVWHDPQGASPPEGVTIPRIEGAFSGEWSDSTWHTLRIDGANCREIVDNVVDMAHFFYVHNSFPTYFNLASRRSAAAAGEA
ncbi:Rieske 2Fe-2S domain-containing protein [Streptomyces reniochalinae]|uniref:Rieske 2Fe-2S domain-containing protein n=1 Tax=Streptomyces reniochalinae TaxID=2250578 RepID=UPI003CCC5C31